MTKNSREKHSRERHSKEEDHSIRALRDGEEPDFLALLADWPFRDNRKGEEFFARSLHGDPSFRLDNVWVAEKRGELVSCCQIFPRPIRVAGEAVPAGGVGTVFTREDQRGRGLACQVVETAVREMQRRGFELALLWSSQLEWYESQGFRRWGAATRIWRLGDNLVKPRLLGPTLSIEQFNPDLHLEGVKALSARYCAERHGTVLRGNVEWQASLALAGDPVEEFVVVMDERMGEAVAFLRGCMLDGSWQVLEWACAAGHESHLAELMAVTLRTVAQSRVVAPALSDDRLERCLAERGLYEEPAPPGTPEWLLRCLAPEALASRFGVAMKNGDLADGNRAANRAVNKEKNKAAGEQEPGRPAVATPDILSMVLPSPAFHFWTSDRF